MSDLSEQITEMSAELLMKAAGELSQVAYNAASFVREVGGDASAIARAQLVKLINSISEKNLSVKERKTLNKIEEAALKDGSTPRQITFLDRDREILEKWLKKQDVLYMTLHGENQNVEKGFEKSVIVFLEKDAEAVNIAVALTQHEKGYINELPAQAMLFLHKKKDLSVIDNLNVFDLEVFRAFAKDFGLVYSTILNSPDVASKDAGDIDTYKILVSKKDVAKAAAVMQQVSWSMSSEHVNDIKEKVKERYSIKSEIQKIVTKGIGPDKVFFQDGKGKTVEVENAKYIVNSKASHQYLKITNKGFVHYKFGKEFESVSKDDVDFENKLQYALGEFSDAVIFDVAEWEQDGLEKANLRKDKVRQKLSLFPAKFNKQNEARDLQKARKHHKAQDEVIPETAWLFDKYDTQKAFSEVYELNYNDYSEPPERTISVHYGETLKYSEKYSYIDVSNDEKSIDNIIETAEERALGNKAYEPSKDENTFEK